MYAYRLYLPLYLVSTYGFIDRLYLNTISSSKTKAVPEKRDEAIWTGVLLHSQLVTWQNTWTRGGSGVERMHEACTFD